MATLKLVQALAGITGTQLEILFPLRKTGRPPKPPIRKPVSKRQ